ncbi:MAG: dephospho-CoA kinase [Firmicutes bacterium]|nr:dephospho-CoA kinase [Bacillota bacterium]
MDEPVVIGLTGGIACGKSTIAKVLKRLGAVIIDADREGKVVVKKDSPAWREIVAEFGREILNPDGSINRRRLGNKVFGQPEKLKRLNSIVHPRMMDNIRDKIRYYKQKDDVPAIVLDAALLFEAKADDLVDVVWVVTVDRETQINRLMNRDKLDCKLAVQRVEAQMPVEEKIARADAVIDNMGTRRQTRERILELWAQYTKID